MQDFFSIGQWTGLRCLVTSRCWEPTMTLNMSEEKISTLHFLSQFPCSWLVYKMYWNQTDKFFYGEGTSQTSKKASHDRPVLDTIHYQRWRWGLLQICRAWREEFLVKIIGNGNSEFRLKKLVSQKWDEESIILTQSCHISPLYWQIIATNNLSLRKWLEKRRYVILVPFLWCFSSFHHS